MTTPSQEATGSYGSEIPVVTLIDKNGKPIKEGDQELVLNSVRSINIQESIESGFSFGTIEFDDLGSFRKSYLYKKGCEYVQIELKSNRNEGDKQTKKKAINFEIINMTGYEDGHLINSGVDRVIIYIAQYPMFRNLFYWNISKGYSKRDSKYIIENLFDDFLKKYPDDSDSKYKFKGEVSKYKMDSYCVPYWNLNDTIQDLKIKSIDSK
jgi:hypothetical protein